MHWECTSQSFDRKHRIYSAGSSEESLIKQLFTKVWARIRKSISDDAVSILRLVTAGSYDQPMSKRDQDDITPQ